MDEDIVNDIIRTRNIIRKKYNALKRGQTDDEAVLERIFKPVTAPLTKLADIPKQELPSTDEYKSVKKAKKLQPENFDDTLPENFFHQKTVSPESVPTDTTNVEEEEMVDLPQFNVMRSTDKFISSLNIDQKEFDYKYGPYFSPDDDKWKIGSLPFSILNSNIIVGDNSYSLTPGLTDLLFLRHPPKTKYDENDVTSYLEIVKSSNVLHRNYDKSQQAAGNKSYKYKFINELLKKQRLSTGSGLMKFSQNKLDYVYWDDPNELVDRLRLLLASQQAGHTNHNNEVISILEELREAKIIL